MTYGVFGVSGYGMGRHSEAKAAELERQSALDQKTEWVCLNCGKRFGDNLSGSDDHAELVRVSREGLAKVVPHFRFRCEP